MGGGPGGGWSVGGAASPHWRPGLGGGGKGCFLGGPVGRAHGLTAASRDFGPPAASVPHAPAPSQPKTGTRPLKMPGRTRSRGPARAALLATALAAAVLMLTLPTPAAAAKGELGAPLTHGSAAERAGTGDHRACNAGELLCARLFRLACALVPACACSIWPALTWRTCPQVIAPTLSTLVPGYHPICPTHTCPTLSGARPPTSRRGPPPPPPPPRPPPPPPRPPPPPPEGRLQGLQGHPVLPRRQHVDVR
jgi:hypothetical protein